MPITGRAIGFVPPDEDWRKMADVWFACKEAGVDVPDAVEAFFDEGPPDPHGQEVTVPYREWDADYGYGIEIEVAKIPKKAKVIRVYYS